MPKFAIAVQPGFEAEAAEMLSEYAGEHSVTLPVSEFRSLEEGALQCREAPMLPGYVFLEAPDARALRKTCRRVRGFADCRSSGMEAYELSQGEEMLIAQFASSGGRAQFSEGSVRNGCLFVSSGALAGHESLVGRINHRGKKAYVPTTVGGNPVELEFGLRVNRKRNLAT